MTNETTIQLSLAATRESPFNPRKKFNEVGLAELAESIKSQGVMQPVVARTVPSFSGWELVFGHRRFRAAKLAGLDSIPAFIRVMDDQQVKIAQIHENLEREDVSAIEEADGFRALLDEGVTAEDLIKETGKSKSYIYGRLKLCNLSSEVREACETGGLPAEVALAIARLPTETAQRKALDLAKDRAYVDGKYQPVGWSSVRAAKTAIKNHQFQIPLQGAPFSLTDATLCANGRNCVTCPLRSDNDADLLDEFGADVCTDTECYEGREACHFDNLMQAHRAAGGTVLEGEEAQEAMRKRYWPLTDATHLALDRRLDYDTGKTVQNAMEALGDAAPPLIWLYPAVGDRPTATVSVEHLPTLRDALGIAAPGSEQSQDSDEDATPGSLRLPLTDEEEACRDHWFEGKEGTDSIRTAIAKRMVGRPRTTDELRLIALCLVEYADEMPSQIVELMGWSGKFANDTYGADTEWFEENLSNMTADELGLFVALWSLFEGTTLPNEGDSQYPARVAFAKAYGVNPLDTEAPPTPSTAAQAQEGAALRSKRNPRAKVKPPVNEELPLGGEEGQAGSAGDVNAEATGVAGGESDAAAVAEAPEVAA